MFKTLGAMLVGAVMLAAGPAVAQTTYSYNGNPYDTFTNFSNCSSGGGCANFAGGMRPSGTFQTAAPLAGGLASADVTAQVIAYAFNDGLADYRNTDAQSRLSRVLVSTDASGNLTQVSILVQRWASAAYAAICDTYACAPGSHPNSAYVDAANKIDQLNIRLTAPAEAVHNVSCARRGVSASGTPETCLGYGGSGDTNASYATAPNAPYPPVVPATAVPTMTEWAMILFGLILAGAASLMIRRRQVI